MTEPDELEPRWARRLTLDIETKPEVSVNFQRWNVNVSPEKVVRQGGLLSWAAKWWDRKEVLYADDRDDMMVERLWGLMGNADIIYTYNGDKFDLKELGREFLLAGLPMPAPYKSVDLYKVVKRHFRFPSSKLNEVAKALGLGEKVKHQGIELWVDCLGYHGIERQEAAYRKMARYNKEDVRLTERLAVELLPWIDNHPPVLLYVDDACNRCGSTEWYTTDKPHVTAAGSTYPQLRCGGCNGWGRRIKRTSGPTIRGVK